MQDTYRTADLVSSANQWQNVGVDEGCKEKSILDQKELKFNNQK